MNSTMKCCRTRQIKRNFSHGDMTRKLLRRGNSRSVADVCRSTITRKLGNWRHQPVAYSAHRARNSRYEYTSILTTVFLSYNHDTD